jgi:hypothetical protein
MSSLFIAASCTGGGPCVYDVYVGLCTGTGGNQFTYEGEVGGEEVTLTGNSLGVLTLDEGEFVECEIGWIEEGTCTPCTIDIGSCGDEAWDFR